MADEYRNTAVEEEPTILGGIDIDIFKYDVRVFLISFYRRLPLIMLIPVAVMAMTVAYVYSVPKKWKATCILFKSTEEMAKKDELSDLRRPLSVEVIKEMIRTKSNMREVSDKLKLSMSIPAMYGATDVEVDEKNKNMLDVIAVTTDPKLSADIANELARVFLDNYEKMRNRSIQKRYDYFAGQKLIVLRDIQKLEDQKEAYLKKNNVNADDLEKTKDLDKLAALNDKITLAEQRQHAFRILIKEYTEKIKKLDPEVKLSYEVTAVDDTKLVEKKNELATLRESYTDLNPKVKKLIAEIEALEKKINSQKTEGRPAGKITYGKNYRLSGLEDKIFNAETELKSLDFALKKYAVTKEKLEERLEKLEMIDDEYKEISRKIALANEMLKKIDSGVTEMALALSASVSDMRIFEEAEPPIYPAVDKRRKKLIFGFLIGIILGGICAVGFELADMTIKSKFDIEHVLGIRPLGSLPRISEVRLKKFYSAVQMVFSGIFKQDIEDSKKNVLIAFGDAEGGTGKTFFIKKCIDVFGPMDKKILYISSCSELASGLVKYKINDYIYNDQEMDVELASENNDHLYFLLDNYSYIVPMKATQIEKFLSNFKDYDFIFWELFEFKKNEPLFATICSIAHTTVLLAKFKKTGKLAMVKCVKHLKDHGIKNIGGIVNSVEKRYFSKGI